MNRLRNVLSLLLLIPALHVSGVTIKKAYTRYYDEGEIRPIRQYFGANLSGQGFRTVIPSQPEAPAGQYFIVRLKDPKASTPASARMTLYTTESKSASVRTWNLQGNKLGNWVYLGLTGDDWTSDEIRPLAWHIELLGADGEIVADWKSFLWELP